jgi:hypothetical protein
MPIPSPSAEDAREMYLAVQGNSLLVLVPDCQSVPTPNFVRTAYLGPNSVTDENQIQMKARTLNSERPLLMMLRQSHDGPPFRSGVVFFYHRSQFTSWRADSLIKHGLAAEVYLASTSMGNDVWKEDELNGRAGYFLTGSPTSSYLWHIIRMEPDAAYRYLFTLAPVKLAQGLPEVDFRSIVDSALRAEAERHWLELKSHLMQHQYYALVTSAKNVAETVLAGYLHAQGISSQRDFSETLQKLAELMKGAKSQPRGQFDFLDYHLMQKMRLLHARTHPTRTASIGRSIKPEFALTIAEDLVEVLTSGGFARAARP